MPGKSDTFENDLLKLIFNATAIIWPGLEQIFSPPMDPMSIRSFMAMGFLSGINRLDSQYFSSAVSRHNSWNSDLEVDCFGLDFGFARIVGLRFFFFNLSGAFVDFDNP